MPIFTTEPCTEYFPIPQRLCRLSGGTGQKELGSDGGHGLLPLSPCPVSLQKGGYCIRCQSAVRKTVHPNEAGQGKDRQERCQGHLRVRTSERGAALQCPDRRAERMSATVLVIGQLSQKTHGHQEQAAWRRDFGHSVKVCVQFPEAGFKTPQ